jgi:OpgC protein
LLNRSYEVAVGFAWSAFAYVLLRKVQSMLENFGEARTVVLAGPGKRDLRLDLLRGIGQWMVFLDHVPNNFLNWFTIKNYGFSDATEYSFSFPAIRLDLHTGERSKPASL